MTSNQSEALQLHDSVKANVLLYRRLYLGTASRLLDIKNDNKFMSAIGSGIDTWFDYVAQPEIGISVRDANDMIRVAEFVGEHSIEDPSEIPTATLKYMTKRGISDDEMVTAARVLTVKDFKDRYFDHKTNDAGERTYSYMLMKRCKETGNLSRVLGVEEENLLEKFNVEIKNEQ